MASSENTGAIERIFEIQDEKSFNRLCNTQFRKALFLLFVSQKNQDSVELQQLLKESLEASDLLCAVGVVDCDAAETAEVRAQFGIKETPAFIMIDSFKALVKRVQDLDPISLTDTIEAETAAFVAQYQAQKAALLPEIRALTQAQPVMVFIKGTPENPECKFTRELLEALNGAGILFGSCNVFDEKRNLRNWIKDFSGWPTIPQVFVNGSLLGGVDRTKEAIASGEILKQLPATSLKGGASAGLDSCFERDRVLLFATSDFEQREALAENSSAAIQQLQLKGLKFSYEDLKGKQALEQALLQRFGGQASLPLLTVDRQLFRSGAELVHFAKTANFAEAFEAALLRSDINEQLGLLVNSAPLMVFIKGTPAQPQCGFTRQLLAILDGLHLEYSFFNIFSDQLVREKLKEYSNWKTYPQVYVRGEFVGGLDIVKELVEAGEFQDMTKELVKK